MNGHGKGTRSPGHSRAEQPQEGQLRQSELRCDTRQPTRKRAIRAREGLLHRGGGAEGRTLRAGAWGYALSRRDRRDPLELQPKLLRAIQDQEFERVGGNRTIRTDIRFVAATNRNLKGMVEENKFRGDLYYRLHVFPLEVPPLRERREDIPLLIRYFVQKHAQRIGRKIETIPTQALEALTNYDWPGNIRELQNFIERSVILSAGSALHVAMPELSGKAAPAGLHGRPANISEAAERTRILQALKDAKGMVGGPNGAAERLGLARTTLQSRMRKYNIGRLYQ